MLRPSDRAGYGVGGPSRSSVFGDTSDRRPCSAPSRLGYVTGYVQHYNELRLHSAIGYVTPLDKRLGREQKIHDPRDRKLAEARERRRQNRQRQAAAEGCYIEQAWTVDRAGQGEGAKRRTRFNARQPR